MAEATIPALRAPAPKRDNPLTRSLAGMLGTGFLGLILIACIGSLPYTLAEVRAPGAAASGGGAGGGGADGSPRYDEQIRTARHLPPWWLGTPVDTRPDSVRSRLDATARIIALEKIASERGAASIEELERQSVTPTAAQLAAARPRYWMGSDLLGRSLLVRSLTGGGISLCIGIAAALLSVFLGTMYGAIAGYAGGRTDAIMMRIVDILYGLPYILLVVLLAVASESIIDEFVSRERARAGWANTGLRLIADSQPAAAPAAGSVDLSERLAAIRAARPDPGSSVIRSLVADAIHADPTHIRWPAGATPQSIIAAHTTTGELLDQLASVRIPARELSGRTRTFLDLTVLFVAIGGVSWLTMARVVRGQVLSLKAQPFMEAARAMGVPVSGLFLRHLLPNLVGPITVYATLTIPQAILQESFLSFLGIGVRPPLPSWGNLAAEGLVELNPYESRWWLLLFPCLLLGSTLLALNFVGEGLREALDPKRARR